MAFYMTEERMREKKMANKYYNTIYREKKILFRKIEKNSRTLDIPTFAFIVPTITFSAEKY